MSNPTTIRTTVENGVFTITLNRPEKLNAFTEQMSIELNAAMRTAERDDAVRCIVLAGEGRAFCSGQDLEEIKDRYAAGATSDFNFAAHLRQKYNPFVAKLRTIEKPVVAAVNGVAAGAGASFAFACDLRIAKKSATFVMSFVHVGLVPDSVATQTLVQHVGLGKACEYCFLGEKITADEAERFGLVNRVVADDEFAAYVGNLATRLAALPTRAIGLTKRALNKAWNATVDEQLEYEALAQSTAGNSLDHREGVMAFLEKRKAKFVGR